MRVAARKRVAYIFDTQAAIVAALSGVKAITEYIDNIAAGAEEQDE